MGIEIKCHECGHTKGIIIDSGPHKKLICKKCFGYIKFLSKEEVKKFEAEKQDEKINVCIKDLHAKIDKLTEMVKRVGIMINDYTFKGLDLNDD